MTIKHSKVSGVANTGSTVGGGDWDADHVVTGFRMVGYIDALDNDGTMTVSGTSAFVSGFSRQAAGRYGFNFTTAGLPTTGVVVLAVVPEVNAEIGTIAMMTPKIDDWGGGADLKIYQSIGGVISFAAYAKFKVFIYRTD